MPIVIGLTGNIACGKSTVATVLAELGIQHIDADKIGHELMEHGQPVWQQIVDKFGRDVIAPDGKIDRKALGQIVFADPSAMRELEQITHKAITAAVLDRVAKSKAKAVAVEAVKLAEGGMRDHCNSIWVIVCSHDEEKRRLREERGLSEEESLYRLAAQPDATIQAAYADEVIENSGSLVDLRRQIVAAWARTVGNTLKSDEEA